MRVIVTGSSGRIGRAIHFNLCRDHEVIGIDRTPSSATCHVGDIDDYDFLARSFEGGAAIIHTAALHAPHVGIASDEEFERTNIGGTGNVVRAAKACGIGRLVFTSTTALYGNASQHPRRATWIDEGTKPRPRSIYHRTKLEAEKYLESEASEGFHVISLRMSRCFPEPAPVMAAYRLHRGIDARDVAEGHRLALKAQGAPCQVYILSGATPFQPEDCAMLKENAKRVLRARCPQLCELFERRNWPLPASVDRVYDPALAGQALGWKPRYGFEEVVRLLDDGLAEVLPPQAAGTAISE
jgi:nucleoside-diphosphate-sugar epimerase